MLLPVDNLMYLTYAQCLEWEVRTKFLASQKSGHYLNGLFVGYIKNIEYVEKNRISPTRTGASGYDSADFARDVIKSRYVPSDKWRKYRNILK
jgi:hypothetical protein